MHGQTTQGMIRGQVRAAVSGIPVARARIRAVNPSLNIELYAETDALGWYAFILLPPGEYWIRAEAPTQLALQPVEVHGLSLPVAGVVEQPIEMRPLADLFGQRGLIQTQASGSTQVLRFYGPDVDVSRVAYLKSSETDVGQLEPSASEVLDPRLVEKLPLAGRDVYSALVLLPGFTSDASTVRSLGLSANGQRPTSSVFLLDGLDDNNHILTGNFPEPPEAIEEYRVSTNNFSAEYGGTSGYIANAVTRRGGSAWRGIIYANTQDEVLDANSFQNNSNGINRQPFLELQDGLQAGGPVAWKNLFSATAFESFRSRSYADPQDSYLPTASFVRSLPAGSIAAALFRSHPPLQYAINPDPNAVGGEVALSPPVHLYRWTGLERLDYVRSSRQQIMGRVSAGSLDRPDFNWTPYGQAGLRQSWTNAGFTATQVWTPAVTGELRAGFMRDSQGWSLANQDLPMLTIASGAPSLELPSADGPASRNVGYHSHSSGLTAGGGIAGVVGKHVWKSGGGLLMRYLDEAILFESNGSYRFDSPDSFRLDQPYQVEAPLSRIALESGNYAAPATSGHYHYDEFSGYFQDDYRATPRLTINAGLRYEWFGAPRASSDTRIATVGLNANQPAQSVPNARVELNGPEVFQMNPGTWSGRFGLSFTPRFLGDAMTFRLGYGMFRDALYDNLWLTVNMNDLTLGDVSYADCNVTRSYLSLGAAILKGCQPGTSSGFFNLTAFSVLRPPLLHSFFLDASVAPWRGWKLEASGTGSVGTGLIDTDVLNRNGVTGAPPNSTLPPIYYRGNWGSSVYTAMKLSVLYHSSHALLRVFYTWSHSIDDQSDPLLGDFFDLGFSNQTDRTPKTYYGAFTFPNNPAADRGNSDFDQRHNFVVFSYWDIPSTRRRGLETWSRNWQLAETFVMRSGLPYSVYAGDQNCQPLCNTRANLIDPAAAYSGTGEITGGKVLLNAAAFGIPPDGINGNTGRNEFRGPGFWNLDLSLGRTFSIPGMGDRGQLQLRADVFNIFNHANLQAPQAFLGTTDILSTFGDALYGRTGNSGFPALTPFVENSRQVQILLRFRF